MYDYQAVTKAHELIKKKQLCPVFDMLSDQNKHMFLLRLKMDIQHGHYREENGVLVDPELRELSDLLDKYVFILKRKNES